MGVFAIAGLLVIGLLASMIGGGDDGGGSEPEPGNDDDLWLGSDAADTASTGPGDDILLGGAGDDTLNGGEDDDLLAGEAGNDDLGGGRGDDILLGGDGDDVLRGWHGDDSLLGGAGDDYLSGRQGDDHLIGGTGSDTIEGGSGNDLLDGRDVFSAAQLAQIEAAIQDFDALEGTGLTAGQLGRISDGLQIRGEPGSDLIRGGLGDDTLIGDSDDTLTGGGGIDHFIVAHDGSADFDRVVVRDFDVTSESLDILLPDDMVAGELTYVARGPDTLIRLGDDTVAVISRATPEEVAVAAIRVLGGAAAAA